jgi:hypothetical protein
VVEALGPECPLEVEVAGVGVGGGEPPGTVQALDFFTNALEGDPATLGEGAHALDRSGKVTEVAGPARLGRRRELEEALPCLPAEPHLHIVAGGPTLELVLEVGLDVLGALGETGQREGPQIEARMLVTRKGAVRAGAGELGIIPGSMGARSYIVRGKGNPESFCSCSHGAGRALSRTEAKRRFSVDDHRRATEGIECRKDEGVIDETPAAYKDIDAVMQAQAELVDVVYTLRQVVCVKG